MLDIFALENVRKLWVCGSFDGPVSGLAIYQGNYYWFDLHPELTVESRPREYVLYPITIEEFEIETKRQNVWREVVGMTSDYDSQGRRYREPSFNPNYSSYVAASRLMDSIRGQDKVREYKTREIIGYFK